MKIVFVDFEEEYLMLLVMKFIDKLKDMADMTMITEKEYLHTYLKEPHDIDILIINKELYDPRFERYNINFIFNLVEKNIEKAEAFQKNEVYKYSSTNEIYARIACLSNLQMRSKEEGAESKIIMVYSPIGGCGKTFTSLGIAKALSNLNQKVLYLDAQLCQSFQFFIPHWVGKAVSKEPILEIEQERFREVFQNYIDNEGFDYMSTLVNETFLWDMDFEAYIHLLDQIKKLKIYDYIILDMSCEFTQSKAKLMGEVDKVIMVTNQDKMSYLKMSCFLKNIDYSHEGKFVFIMNRYDSKETNLFEKGESSIDYEIVEHIKKIPERAEGITTNNIGEMMSFQKIAYYLL